MRLKELRQSRKLLQRDVADALNCSTPVYCRYEKGEREPPFDTLKKLAEFYGVSIDYLMGGEATQNETTKTQAQQKSPSTIDEQIMKELEGMTTEQCREVLNFIRFQKSQEVRTK